MKPQREKTRNVHFLRFFYYSSCSLGEMIKFKINKSYNRKIYRVLNNQQLKYPIELKNRVIDFKFFSPIFSIGKNTDIPYFFLRALLMKIFPVLPRIQIFNRLKLFIIHIPHLILFFHLNYHAKMIALKFTISD